MVQTALIEAISSNDLDVTGKTLHSRPLIPPVTDEHIVDIGFQAFDEQGV